MRGENILGVSVGDEVDKIIGDDDDGGSESSGADDGGSDTDVTGPDVGKRKDKVGPTVL